MVALDKYQASILKSIEWLEIYSECGNAFDELEESDKEDVAKLIEDLRDMHEEVYGDRWQG